MRGHRSWETSCIIGSELINVSIQTSRDLKRWNKKILSGDGDMREMSVTSWADQVATTGSCHVTCVKVREAVWGEGVECPLALTSLSCTWPFHYLCGFSSQRVLKPADLSNKVNKTKPNIIVHTVGFTCTAVCPNVALIKLSLNETIRKFISTLASITPVNPSMMLPKYKLAKSVNYCARFPHSMVEIKFWVRLSTTRNVKRMKWYMAWTGMRVKIMMFNE